MNCPLCINETGQQIEMTEVFRSYREGDKGDGTAPPDQELDYIVYECPFCGEEITEHIN